MERPNALSDVCALRDFKAEHGLTAATRLDFNRALNAQEKADVATWLYKQAEVCSVKWIHNSRVICNLQSDTFGILSC